MHETSNQIIFTIVLGTAIILFFGCCIIFFIFAYKRRHQRHLHEKQKMQLQYQQEMLKAQLEIQEQTFKTISQEIHDNIGQMLSLAKLNLNTTDFSKQEVAMRKVGDAKELVGKAIQDLRDISRTLNTDVISSVGLINAIETELNLLQKASGVEVESNTSGRPVRLEPQQELILFRIVQEALHNIIKHAGATKVAVNAGYVNNNLRLKITDNGQGFDMAAKASGSGLRNMQNRSKLIGATCVMESAVGKGTSIELSINTNN